MSVTEYGGTAEDVRDDERTRATRAAAPDGAAGAEPSAPAPERRVEGTGSAAVVEQLLSALATAERAREQAEAERDEARRRADELAAALDQARAQPPETFGMRADRVLRMAEHEATLRRRAADEEAEQVREIAHAEAERVTTDARAEAERIRAAARAEVQALHDAGASALRDGELVADTAASMHEHVSELRSGVRDEIARLHALLGTELNRLDGPIRLRGSRTPSPGPAPAAEAAGPAPDDTAWVAGEQTYRSADEAPAEADGGTGPASTDEGAARYPAGGDTLPDPGDDGPGQDPGEGTAALTLAHISEARPTDVVADAQDTAGSDSTAADSGATAADFRGAGADFHGADFRGAGAADGAATSHLWAPAAGIAVATSADAPGPWQGTGHVDLFAEYPAPAETGGGAHVLREQAADPVTDSAGLPAVSLPSQRAEAEDDAVAEVASAEDPAPVPAADTRDA